MGITKFGGSELDLLNEVFFVYRMYQEQFIESILWGTFDQLYNICIGWVCSVAYMRVYIYIYTNEEMSTKLKARRLCSARINGGVSCCTLRWLFVGL